MVETCASVLSQTGASKRAWCSGWPQRVLALILLLEGKQERKTAEDFKFKAF